MNTLAPQHRARILDMLEAYGFARPDVCGAERFVGLDEALYIHLIYDARTHVYRLSHDEFYEPSLSRLAEFIALDASIPIAEEL